MGKTVGVAVATALVLLLAGPMQRAQGAGPSGPRAPATTVVDARGAPLAGPYNAWVRRSLVPTPPGKIVVRLRACPGYPRLVACVRTRHPRTIWMRPDVRHNRTVFLHELGHVFDLTVMSRRDRSEFKRIHRRRASWFYSANAPGEWFADAYGLCARRSSLKARARASGYFYRPTPRRHAASCRLIGRSAARLRPQKPVSPPVIIEPPPAPVPPPPAPRRCFLLFFCSGQR